MFKKNAGVHFLLVLALSSALFVKEVKAIRYRRQACARRRD